MKNHDLLTALLGAFIVGTPLARAESGAPV